MHENHVNIIQEQKPIDLFWLKTTEMISNPKNGWFEIFNENAWKMWFKWKRKGKRDLLKLEDKNPWKIWGRKQQKML